MSNEIVDIYNINKEKLILRLTDDLPVLRAKIGVSQAELSEIVGVSRQTYSSIETKKRTMTWSTFMAILMFFSSNELTVEYLRTSGLFPIELQNALNVSRRV